MANSDAREEKPLFKHILLPTDGSKLSDRAVERGIALARDLRARITALHVMPELRMIADESFVMPMGIELQKRYDREARARAQKMLDRVAGKAEAEGIQHQEMVVSGELPYEAIIAVAKKQKCDLIMMASHGRRGVSGLLLGSETAKVLTHSKIPVLVVR
jgi:nucleotide-binding universal stress UspA family protein